MDNLTFAIVAFFILAFAAVSGRITKTVITPPMVFVLFGVILGQPLLNKLPIGIEHPLVHFIAEITLVVVLFTDASRIDLRRLRSEHDIPIRLLSIGLPLTMILGTVIAMLIFPNLSVWEAALLAIMLAPTDAALGQAVVSSPSVPVRIRQALNVESGLNDGIALPILFLFVCITLSFSGTHEGFNWFIFAALQLTLGPIAGIGVGYLGGKLVMWGSRTGWMNHAFLSLSSIALALFAFAFAETIGGNGFIAAFAAGLIIGNTTKEAICEVLYEFGETEGQLLTLLTFLFFGAIMLPPAIAHLDLSTVIYALLSLTVVRMLPVALSLLGLGLRISTKAFLGWFGPRGIATILYGLLILEEAVPAHESLFHIAMVTVFFSIILHGFTAWPWSNWYGSHMNENHVESRPVSEMPLRH